MDNREKNIIFLLLMLIIIYLIYLNFCKTPSIEGFSNAFPTDWKKLAEHQCNYLQDEILKIDSLLNECSKTDKLDQKSSLNYKITCRDANEMNINSVREKGFWCDTAKKVVTISPELLSAQGTPDSIEDNNLNLVFTDNYNTLDNKSINTIVNTIDITDEVNKKYSLINYANGYNKSDDNFASI
jgi:hypothetical protein